MDKLWALEVFVRVAEAKSFSRAADSLDLANATVSSCVRNLESHLGVTLINRDTRRLSLTEEGLRLLPQARELLESVRRIEDDTRASPGRLRGPLHVEIPISLGNVLLCPALPEFIRRYPDIAISVVQTNRPHHMIEQAIDVAVRMESVEDDDLIARPLFESRYVAVGTAALAAALPAHPRELDPRCCLGVSPEDRWHANRWVFDRAGEHVEIRPAGPLTMNSSDAVLRAAMGGVGLALLLDVFANPLLEAGDLVRVYAEWQTETRQFYIVTARSSVGSARVQAFSAFLLGLFPSGKAAEPDLVVPVRAVRR